MEIKFKGYKITILQILERIYNHNLESGIVNCNLTIKGKMRDGREKPNPRSGWIIATFSFRDPLPVVNDIIAESDGTRIL